MKARMIKRPNTVPLKDLADGDVFVIRRAEGYSGPFIKLCDISEWSCNAAMLDNGVIIELSPDFNVVLVKYTFEWSEP